MKIIKKTIEVNTFLDNNGGPTCGYALGRAREECPFYYGDPSGSNEACAINNEPLVRNYNGMGYLIPTRTCPIWNP
jgi:hypothetical protein